MIAAVAHSLAFVLAWRLSVRRPEHRPVEYALALALMVRLTRQTFDMSPELDLALYLAYPALSAWCAVRVLSGHSRIGSAIEALLIGGIPWLSAQLDTSWWVEAPTTAHLMATTAQGLATAAWWTSGRPTSATATCALVLCAEGVTSLLGPVLLGGPWWIVEAQSAFWSAVLVVVQAAALARILWGGKREADPFGRRYLPPRGDAPGAHERRARERAPRGPLH